MAMRQITIDTPLEFNYRNTIRGHGWYHLKPFDLDASGSLRFVINAARGPSAIAVNEKGRQLAIETDGVADDVEAACAVRHVLRLDDDLGQFYESVTEAEGLEWVRKHGAGRLLRSPTVWEDLVKTICTTNCSWGLTKIMVSNLVEKLGEPVSEPPASAGGTLDGASRSRAFPTAAAMANVNEPFYRNEIKAGYRSPYFIELAESVASGKIDPEAWLTSDLPTADLKKQIKSVKGVGNYAAENLLKLLGRYDGLALDSWLRARFYACHNNDKQCPDKKIERHYSRYKQWRGLAIWCDMTRHVFEQD